MTNLADPKPSVFGRLLQEISWEGHARKYRQGGRGFENVLTAEVFQALDLLPRGAFLGHILRSCVTGASAAVAKLAEEIEHATLTLLPGDVFLSNKPNPVLSVQPDVIIESPSVYCLVEAKRIRAGARFQREQLAREYLTALQVAQITSANAGRPATLPLLLLVVPEAPPITVAGIKGKIDVVTAISMCLDDVLPRCKHSTRLKACLPEDPLSVVAHTTWDALLSGIALAESSFTNPDDSVRASVRRMAHAALDAIGRHG
jgi:hypothetical protein